MSTAVSADRPHRAGIWRARVGAALGAGVVILAAVVAGAPTASALPQLQSEGSSFAGVAIEQWIGQSQASLGLNINFNLNNSVDGLNGFAQNQVDFGASDIPYSSGQATNTPTQPYQYMPDVAGALAFMYNLTGNDGQQIKNLVLNASTIEGIFTGAIYWWDDPSIEALNPQEAGNLPHEQIIPVTREDAAGESYLLSDYLLHTDGSAFTAYEGAVQAGNGQPTAQWPIEQPGEPPPPASEYPNAAAVAHYQQDGSDGVANFVSALASQGAIGYLETAYAIQHNFPVASVVNESGNAVQPTSVNDATALEKAILFADLTQDLANVYTNPLPNAYPISAYSYIVAPCSPSLAAAQQFNCTGPQGTSPFPTAKGQELGEFVSFLACAGQQKMALLGYSPLPPNLVQEDFDAVGRMNGGQQPPPPTASSCQNPYVDGQVPLPGEPQIDTGVSDVNSSGAAAAAAAASTGSGSRSSGSEGAGEVGGVGSSGSVGGPGGDTGGSSVASGGSGGGSVGSSSSGGSYGAAGTPTQAAGNQFTRFNALEKGATTVTGPPLSELVLLWCAAIVIAALIPPVTLAWWRRRRHSHDATTEPMVPAPELVDV